MSDTAEAMWAACYEEREQLRATLAERDRQIAFEQDMLVRLNEKWSIAEERVAALEAALRDCRDFLQPVKGNERSERQLALIDEALAAPVAPCDPSTNAQEGT